MSLGTVRYAGSKLVNQWLKANHRLGRIGIGTRTTDLMTWGEFGTYELFATDEINSKIKGAKAATVPFSPASTAPSEIVTAAVLLTSHMVYSALMTGANPNAPSAAVESWRERAYSMIDGYIASAKTGLSRPVYSNQVAVRDQLHTTKGVAGFGTGAINDAVASKKWTTNR